MCGRFANHVQDMHRWVDLLTDWPAGIATGFNVAPTQAVPVVSGDGVVSMRWGLVPSWSKEANPKYATFNARLETVAEKPAFRSAWKQKRRCMIPIRGYYEWKPTPTGKQPFFVGDANAQLLVMAGLWEERQKQRSFTVLTEPASEAMTALHPRMPVVLTPESASEWLAGSELAFLPEGAARVELEYFQVSREVNNVHNNGEQLIEPQNDSELGD